jgi:DTW domain-containing protein YfiP
VARASSRPRAGRWEFPHAAVPAGRCPRCAFPPEACLCPEIPRLAIPWRVVILRHASEIPRMTNSGRWAALALEGAVLHDHARDGAPADGPALQALVGAAPAALLFPSPNATGRPPEGLRTIVVPDATWSQARRMVQRLAPLQRLPRLALPAPPPALRMRQPPVAGGMSTLEAVAAALELLGDAAAGARLRALHAAAVERTLRLKGMWPPDRNPHP